MAFNKLKPRQVDPEHLKAIAEQAKAQRFYQSVPKSEDPDNYPVFSISQENNLIYVPNYVVENEEGMEELRMDKPFLYSVKDGSQFLKLRSPEGIVDEALGLDGSDPIADAFQLVTELAQKEAARHLVANGFQADDQSDEARKLTSHIYGGRIIKQKQRTYTFPIVVFERTSEEKNGRKTYKLVLDENGKPKYQVMWYSISENLYNDTGKWKEELNNRSEEYGEDFLTPAGLFFQIKGDYTRKPNEEWSAFNAARKFAVVMSNPPKEIADLGDEFLDELDKAAEDWTPEKAIEMVIANHFYSVEDLRVELDRLIQPVKDKLALLELGEGTTEPAKAIATTAAPKGQQALASLDDDEIDDPEDE
jgi:hypothetical protein